jgi:hypothetical protein
MSVVGLTRIKVARNATPVQLDASRAQDPALDDAEKKTLTDALAAVAAYVPTEIIAAYTLTLAVAVNQKPTTTSDGQVIAPALALSWYFIFLGLVPVFVWLVFAARSRETKSDFLSWRLWPWWEAFAASVAFTVWSAALPQSAFVEFTWYNSGIAAIVLMLVSGLLPLVGAVITKPSKSS